jgi:hypothetical protein
MPRDFSFYDNVQALERFLNLPEGGLRNIPIYARAPAVDAIIKVREMEAKTQFRPGLYYIVLADLRGNTAFNAKYRNGEADVRVQWFQTAVVQTIGELDIHNYIAFSKTIGDAALLIFSSFADVFAWSQRLTVEVFRSYSIWVEMDDVVADPSNAIQVFAKQDSVHS